MNLDLGERIIFTLVLAILAVVLMIFVPVLWEHRKKSRKKSKE